MSKNKIVWLSSINTYNYDESYNLMFYKDRVQLEIGVLGDETIPIYTELDGYDKHIIRTTLQEVLDINTIGSSRCWKDAGILFTNFDGELFTVSLRYNESIIVYELTKGTILELLNYYAE